MRLRLASLLSAIVAAAAAAAPDSEAAALAEENSMLQLKLKRLEDELQQELKYSYVIACVDTYAVPQPCRTYRVVVKGYITDAENVFMETMEVDEAKQYCNANAKCKGFTFAGPEERPEDEVTITFKAGSKVTHDASGQWISFVKESSMDSVFGALHGAIKPGNLDQLESPSIVTQGLTFEGLCLVFAIGVALIFACRKRRAQPST